MSSSGVHIVASPHSANRIPWSLPQDVHSRSWLVRTYYKHRLLMGVCCISCEVLYLSVSVSPDLEILTLACFSL